MTSEPFVQEQLWVLDALLFFRFDCSCRPEISHNSTDIAACDLSDTVEPYVVRSVSTRSVGKRRNLVNQYTIVVGVAQHTFPFPTRSLFFFLVKPDWDRSMPLFYRDYNLGVTRKSVENEKFANRKSF